MNSSQPSKPNEQPIEDFSLCHVGILDKLDLLGELPGLLGPAARAREIAAQAVAFFREAVFEHHLDEERELFPAVLDSAAKGEERERVQAIVKQLTEEHRELENQWKHLEPRLKKVAKGLAADLDASDLQRLIMQYREHARFEEASFLPLAQQILGRNSHHLAALGLSLHMRHAPPPIRGYV